MSTNPAAFIWAAAGCAVLIVKGRRMTRDPSEDVRSMGELLYRNGIIFSCLLALIIILLIVDEFGLPSWVA